MTALRWTRRGLDTILLVALAAVALAAVVALAAPATSGRAMVIGGASMEPAIPKGALVLAAPAQSYGVGDVVAVQQPGSTPYTHRITRLAALDGVPHVETKGDANEEPDPAIVPRASIIGRVDVALPLLGYLAVLLTSVPGFVGFVALGGSLLIMSGALEELEDRFGPVCAPEADAATGAIEPNDLDASADGGLAAPVGLAAAAGSIAAASIDAPAASRTRARTTGREPAVSRVRETGRARDPHLPVPLDRDRRNPRRHGIATAAATAPQPAPELAA